MSHAAGVARLGWPHPAVEKAMSAGTGHRAVARELAEEKA
jgi:hypothetical protein